MNLLYTGIKRGERYTEFVRIVLDIPDDAASLLLASSRDPARSAIEAMAIQAYRERRITAYQLRSLLGIPSRYELDGFLKRHCIYDYSLDDFEHDLAAIRASGEKNKADRSA